MDAEKAADDAKAEVLNSKCDAVTEAKKKETFEKEAEEMKKNPPKELTEEELASK
jgi:GTP-binding protein EngB required for normal cell division